MEHHGETPPFHHNPYSIPPILPPSSSYYHPCTLSSQPQHQQYLQPSCGFATQGINLARLLFPNPVGFLGPQLQSLGVLDTLARKSEEEGNGSGGSGDGKGKVTRRGKKVSQPRFEFQTRSVNDILDDGYRWRKYGQKAVKNSVHPRSYYRCTHHTCNVKKQVQRLAKDPCIVATTYEGVHNHPCEKLMETLTPILNQIQLFSQL